MVYCNIKVQFTEGEGRILKSLSKERVLTGLQL